MKYSLIFGIFLIFILHAACEKNISIENLDDQSQQRVKRSHALDALEAARRIKQAIDNKNAIDRSREQNARNRERFMVTTTSTPRPTTVSAVSRGRQIAENSRKTETYQRGFPHTNRS